MRHQQHPYGLRRVENSRTAAFLRTPFAKFYYFSLFIKIENESPLSEHGSWSVG